MSWVAAAVAVVGGVAQHQASKKAAKAGQAGEAAAIAEQQRQYDQTRADNMPWLQAGQGALAKLEALNNGDYSGFNQSPDYLWAQESGVNALDRSAAARGNLFSGGHSVDLTKFGQGNATQYLGNYRGSLQSLAGVGQTAANNLGVFGQNAADSIGQGYRNQGAIRASSYQQQGDNYGQLAAGLGGMWNRYYNANKFGGV